jgi:hypothetical protein
MMGRRVKKIAHGLDVPRSTPGESDARMMRIPSQIHAQADGHNEGERQSIYSILLRTRQREEALSSSPPTVYGAVVLGSGRGARRLCARE